MKKTTFTFLLTLSCCWLAAQCPTGDVTFSTQGQVDSFQINYPNCDSIRGSLRIGPSTDIADLSALTGIRFVKNSIKITENQALVTLSGLDSIYSFGRFPLVNYKSDSLVIQNNDQLLNLKGLGNPSTRMATPLMYVLVADNDALTTLEGFEFLQRAGDAVDFGFGGFFPFGGVRIRHNINLVNLNGLDGLSGGFVEIQDNDNLKSLEGFGHSFGDSATAYLIITENDALLNLWGLDSLFTINSLSISKNSNLQNLTGLQNLVNVNGGYLYEDEGGVALTWGFEISQNNTLQNLSGLDNLKTVTGYLYISENEQLTQLNGLDSLQFLYEGHLKIDGNPALLNIDALSNLKAITQFYTGNYYVGSTAAISRNKLLADLNGLHQIDSLSWLVIEDNDALTSLGGLENLQRLGSLEVYGNDSLTSLAALQNINKIEGDLTIGDNYSLSSLTGLENIDSIGGNLRVTKNNSLATLSGLNNLTANKGRLYIGFNNALASLQGLDSLDTSSIVEIYLEWNPLLSYCSIQPICAYLDNGGKSIIDSNAPGCNSIAEVEAACMVSLEETSGGKQVLHISPNPARDFLKIQIDDPNKWDIRLFGPRGQLLYRQPIAGSQTVPLNGWPAGLYTLRAVSGRRVFAGKIVKY